MTGIEEKALYIGQRCIQAGMTVAGAAGILINIEHESAFKSTNLQDVYENSLGMNDATYTAAVDSGRYQRFAADAAGYGLCQWTAGDRKSGMLSFHRSRGKSIGDFKTQVEWMLTEIRNYAKAWKTVTTSDQPFDCGYAVCKYYEIPANTENQANYRGHNAAKWFDFLSAALESGAAANIQDEPAAQPKPDKVDGDGLPVPTTWPPRTIDAHCTGWPEVKLAQALLHCRGYGVTVDGIWSDQMSEKIKDFQRALGLTPDGVIGPATWGCLMSLS